MTAPEAAPATGRFRTEGGAVLELDLPLSRYYADAHRRGELVSVPDETDTSVAAPVAAIKPAPTDDKGAWVDYAVASGMTRGQADRMTKPKLIEFYAAA